MDNWISAVDGYSIGAATLGWLAYPCNRMSRNQFGGAILFVCSEHTLLQPGGAARISQSLHLLRSQIDARTANRIVERGFRIINNERLLAVKMASPSIETFLRKQRGLPYPAFTPGPFSEPMVSAISKDLADPRREKDRRGRRGANQAQIITKGNLKTQIWDPSKPVLHLAMALATEMGIQSCMSVSDIIFDLDFVLQVVRSSCLYREPISKVFHIAAAQQKDISEVISSI